MKVVVIHLLTKMVYPAGCELGQERKAVASKQSLLGFEARPGYAMKTRVAHYFVRGMTGPRRRPLREDRW